MDIETRSPGADSSLSTSPNHARRTSSWRLLGRRIGKSLAVSVCTTMLSSSILAVLTYFAVTSAGHANVIATLAGIGPSFALNRRWVWKRHRSGDMLREVGPFWAMCLAALVVSTWTVSLAENWAEPRFGDATRTAVVLAASLATFASLWVVQFIVLNVMFSDRDAPTEPT